MPDQSSSIAGVDTVDRYPRFVARLGFIGTVAPMLAILLVAACIFGQKSHRLIAAGVFPATGSMSPLSAAGILCIAVTLIFRKYFSATSTAVFSGISLLIGIAVLTSYSLTGEDRLSVEFASRIWRADPESVVQSSIITATCLVFLALSQMSRIARRSVLADACAGLAMLLSVTALLGYSYGVPDLRSIFYFSTIALYTAVALFFLSVASVAADPETGWAAVITSSRSGGGPTRRQLLSSVIPLLAANLLLRAVHNRHLSVDAAVTFLVLFSLVPLIVLILRDGKHLDARDKEQEAAAQFRQNVAANMATQLDEQARALNQEHQERLLAETGMFRAQRMEAIGHLTGGIAHDFNNLLMAITSTLHLLRMLIAPTHAAHPYLAHLSGATEKGTGLTKQLLVFSRTQLLDVRPVELRPVLAGSRDLIGNALGPDIDIQIAFPEPGIWVQTDADQLQLAILNLALNARDAMPDGGRLCIHCSTNTQAAFEGDFSPCITIHIVDNGIGMSPEVAVRAMEPFFTTKEQGKGTGLGLAQVYGFVQQCRGDLQITSQVGAGTTINLLLRQTFVPFTPPRMPSALAEQLKHNHKPTAPLLLVDDDEHVRTAMAEALRCSGFEVVEASSGARALDLLVEVRPCLAIIDYLMPGMNGAEVAQRARAFFPDLPIIFVSGYADTVALGKVAGAVTFSKPVPIDALIGAISEFTMKV